MKTIKFNVAAINLCTETEGPFKRLTIWLQGCDIHCKGCGNSVFQPNEPNHLMTLEEVIGLISDSKKEFGIEGVTYTGGEPTLQMHFPELTKTIQNLGLGVISFTGHRYDGVKEQLDA